MLNHHIYNKLSETSTCVSIHLLQAGFFKTMEKNLSDLTTSSQRLSLTVTLEETQECGKTQIHCLSKHQNVSELILQYQMIPCHA